MIQGKPEASERSKARGRLGSPGRGVRRALVVFACAVVAVVGVGVWERDGMPHAIARHVYRMSYEQEIADAAGRYGVDPYLVAAVAKVESGFDPEATSSVGAVGLMQVMPLTAEWIARRDDWEGGPAPDLRDPRDSVQLGAYYLGFLEQRFDGDVDAVLAAYNAGQGRVRQWLEGSRDSAAGAAGTPSIRDVDIPYGETRRFVEQVRRFHSLYSRIHPDAFPGLTAGVEVESRGDEYVSSKG